MSSDGANQTNNANHFNANGAERLPAVPGSSQSADVVRQIIEQILANERRRARMEFVRLSLFFLVFVLLMMVAGTWFAGKLLTQLREERRLTEQTWRMMAAPGEKSPPGAKTAGDDAEINTPPALNRKEIAKLEKNINTVSELLKTNPQESSASIQEMLARQQDAIRALNARLNDFQAGPGGEPATPEKKAATTDFISTPIADDVQLRMPVPSP